MSMTYVSLGRSGLKVSRLCLGTMNFGPETSEPDSHAIMDRALECGINFFDTANVYGWKQGAAHFFNPNIANAPDVWTVKKVSPNSMIHLTEKPVELAQRALNYSSRRDETVLDLFGGSGSTLIAAERMHRRACLMEIDPSYCDVIVSRWQDYTGQKADGWRGNE